MPNLHERYYQRAIIRTIWPRPAALSLLASTVLLGHAACGQDAAISPAPLSATNQPSSTHSFQPSTLPPELRLGPFDIQPRITTGVTYDDNILGSAENVESDFIWSLQPAFLAVAGDRLAIEDHKRQYHDVIAFNPDTFIVRDQSEWPGPSFMLDYGPRFNWFTTYNQNDSIDEFLNANLLWPMSQAILGARQLYQLENVSIVEAGKRTDVQSIATDLSSAFRLGEKTSAEINVHRNQTSYERPDLYGFTDWSNDDWLNYQILPRLGIGAGINMGYVEVPGQDGQTYEQVLARGRYQFGERITVDLSAGGQIRQYDSGRSSTTEPVFNLLGYYRLPNDTTSIWLSGYHREQASVFVDANYTVTGVGCGLWQRITDRSTLILGLEYYTRDYLSTVSNAVDTETEQSLLMKVGVDIHLTRHLLCNLTYNFRMLSSNQYEGFNNNQIGAQLTWSY